MNVAKELSRLREMTVTELRRRYGEVFGEPTRSYHKDFLVRRITWRMQAEAEGGFPERAARLRTRALELARDADFRTTLPRMAETEGGSSATATLPVRTDTSLPLPGALLTRDYRGRRINVRVLPKGFEYEGEVYRSLTAVAQAVTGSHWNGRLFFGLQPPPRADT